MNKFYITLIMFSQVLSLSAQKADEGDKKNATDKETNRFYYFEIPSALNGSNIDPTPISNVTANFTESKISLKLGFPSLFADAPETKNLRYSGFVQPSVKATNGIATLYKTDSPPIEFGVTAGFSLILSHVYWLKKRDGVVTTEHASERLWWLSIIGNLDRGNYNIFTPAAGYGQILEKRTEVNASIYISLNNYFASEIKPYKFSNRIWQVAIGYAKANNYSSLKTRTMDEGMLEIKEGSSVYQSVVETTSGKIGKFEIDEGFSGFGEFFYPIKRSKKYGSIYFGNRLTFLSPQDKETILNGVTGFYINLKDRKVDDDKPAKDVVNFSVTGQFLRLNNSSQSDYLKKNFSVLLQVAIPLRFN